MRLPIIIAPAAAALIALAACSTPQEPELNDPAKCGQTQDGSAIVTLAVNANLCTRQLDQKLIIVAEDCGPTMAGSSPLDDCWRGAIAGRPSPDNFRLGSIQAAGGMAINFVASDATAA